jgi:CRISPR system Cascade subunit CasB
MTQPEAQTKDPGAVALALARALQHSSPGDLAAVRRMREDGAAPLFWRMAARYGEIGRRPDAWAAIARILALLTPTGAPEARAALHDRDRHLGAVLCDGGDRGWSDDRPMLSELRLARLLAARDEHRWRALERAARMLSRSRPPGPLVNVADIAWAVLNTAGTGRIAQDYYARLDRAQKNHNEEGQNA